MRNVNCFFVCQLVAGFDLVDGDPIVAIDFPYVDYSCVGFLGHVSEGYAAANFQSGDLPEISNDLTTYWSVGER
jgi:hypothetical protein